MCRHVVGLGGLIEQTRGMIEMFTKAKAAKLIRELVDMFLKMDATTGKEVKEARPLVAMVTRLIDHILRWPFASSV